MPAASSLQILVVDDQMTIRSLVRSGLQQIGITNIEEAPDGEQGLRSLIARPAHLVITDFNMPNLDGLGLLRAIRAYPPTRSTAVIMLTGHTHIDQVRQARDAGVNEFIAKPVSVKTMMQRLVSVIESPRPYVRTKVYFGPCRRRRGADEYRGPERRDKKEAAQAAE